MGLKIMDKFRNLFFAFIIIQPILDIITTLSINYFNLSVTIGVIVRVLFMGLTLVVIILSPKSRLKNWVLSYLFLLFASIGIGFIYNIFAKPVFSFFTEAQFLTKALYFPILFSALFMAYDFTKEQEVEKSKLLRSVSIATIIISITLFVAVLTGTSGNTYPYLKAGYKGWFFAGNELGAIIAITFPLLLIFASIKMKQLHKWYYWLPVFFLGITGVLVGTKVSYFSVLLSTIIFLFSLAAAWFFDKNKRTYLLNLLLAAIFLAVFLGSTPFSPSYTNFTGDFERLPSGDETANEDEEDVEEDPSGDKKEDKFAAEDLGILNVLLSSRNIYFVGFLNYYDEADMAQKLFGMGYAGNYPEKPKLIEMDFFDFFFSFGIIGFLLYLIPFFLLVWVIISTLIKNWKLVFNVENILLASSIVLGLGIAFLAGHVLSAPAVSIYLSLPMVLLLRNLINGPKQEID
ncbi:O-antigen ligase family protein [Mesobacillus jeotgali]|uniref:O-antigen ligase family protein n=1 Tax=Mesobacillus jeotgali TaxID=129985 RepID=UPI001CFCCA9C|nr:O-antigen ligase family protein [Mesobacillus jeotgali]